MGDVGEMWREERKAYKIRRDARIERWKKTMEWLKANGLVVEFLTEYQVRINGMLDLYIVHGRYHNIKFNRRGNFSNIKKLIEETFPGITLKDTL